MHVTRKTRTSLDLCLDELDVLTHSRVVLLKTYLVRRITLVLDGRVKEAGAG